MTISSAEQLRALKRIGRIVARTTAAMGRALEPGITTRELDSIGRAMLESEGARSAPEITYEFPGATCISVFPDIAHGVPGHRVLQPGDLVNIDVSAELGGFFADTGASFVIPPVSAELQQLTADGRRALWTGIRAVKAGAKLSDIGRAVHRFADRRGYSIIRNLTGHGVGSALHEEPRYVPHLRDANEKRRIADGLVFTIEPFLSMGSTLAISGKDGWTLAGDTDRPTVQYEHTLVATKSGAVVVTLADE